VPFGDVADLLAAARKKQEVEATMVAAISGRALSIAPGLTPP
jgi:hypothetical protein